MVLLDKYTKAFMRLKTYITVFVLLLLPSFSQASLKDGLVSYWKMDEITGIRSDAQGNNHLSDIGNVVGETGKLNRSANFESDFSKYLFIEHSEQNGLQFSGPFSISAWVKLESNGEHAILGKGSDPSSLEYGLAISGANKIVFFIICHLLSLKIISNCKFSLH